MKGKTSLVWLVSMGCILGLSAQAQQLDTIIFLPDTLGGLSWPTQLVPNPVTGNAYVVNEDGDVVVFDPAAMVKVRVFRGDHTGAVFCPEFNKLLLATVYPAGFQVVDAGADTLLRTVEFGDEYLFQPMAYSRTSGKLYSSLEESGVLVFDVTGDTVLKTLPGLEQVVGAVWDSLHDRVYAGHDYGAVSVIDCASDSVVAVIEPVGSDLYRMALNPLRHKLYCSTGDSLEVIDTDSLLVVARIPAKEVYDELLYNPVYDRVYGLGRDSFQNWAYVIDCAADTVVRKLLMEGPVELASSPFNGRTYVGCTYNHGIAVLDQGDTVAYRLFEDNLLLFTALGFAAGRGEMYCAMERDTVFIVDAETDTLKAKMPLETYFVYGMVFNPAGRKLYLLCPGQDVVLVLGPDYRVISRIGFPLDDPDAFPLLNPALNRLYIADRRMFWVIDCNRDMLVNSHPLAGFNEGIPLLSPDMSRLYLFPENAVTGARVCWVYDCYADSFTRAINIGERVPCAVFHPQSNRFYFGCDRPPVVRILDPVAESIVGTIEAGHDLTDGRMVADTERDRVYLTNDRSDSLYVIDVRGDTVVGGIDLPVDADTLFWNQRLGKLYLSRFSSTSGATYVYDCRAGGIVGMLPDAVYRAGLLNPRNDKLFLGTNQGISVYDCRTDSLLVTLPEVLRPRFSAWDPIANRVFFAQRASWVAVFQDEPTAVVEQPGPVPGFGVSLLANPCHGQALVRCQVPAGLVGRLAIVDVAGRRVAEFALAGQERPVVVVWNQEDGAGRRVPAGVYFARLETGARAETVKVVME